MTVQTTQTKARPPVVTHVRLHQIPVDGQTLCRITSTGRDIGIALLVQQLDPAKTRMAINKVNIWILLHKLMVYHSRTFPISDPMLTFESLIYVNV